VGLQMPWSDQLDGAALSAPLQALLQMRTDQNAGAAGDAAMPGSFPGEHRAWNLQLPGRLAVWHRVRLMLLAWRCLLHCRQGWADRMLQAHSMK
jgi:hypothetical protein